MGKGLALINGKSLISIVYQNAVTASQVSEVIVATDDERIYKHCTSHGMKVVYTSKECPSGSERVAEVASTLTTPYVFELQGDQPLMIQDVIDDFICQCKDDHNKYPTTDVFIAVAECPEKDTLSRDVLKVFMDRNKRLLFQTRQPVKTGYRTLGLYLWKRDSLVDFAKRPVCSVERQEESHPVRLYFEGFHVQGIILPGTDWVEVDRKHDIKRVETILNKAIQKKKRRLKVGILGYGYMGKIRHNTLNEFEEFEVAGIYDPDKSAGENLDQSLIYDSADALMRQSDIDVIFVCVPNYLAKNYVIKALEAGKHVFCEKPPGINSQEVREIAEVSKRFPTLKSKFGFNHRYNSSIMKLFELTESGQLGSILWVRGAYGKGPDGRMGNHSWRSQKDFSGGGILMDQGIHILDICLMLCGPFEEVKSMIGTQYWDQGIEDNAFIIMRNKKGQMVEIHSSATQWKHLFRLEVFYEKGYIIVNGMVTKSGSYGPETIIIGQNHEIESANALGRPREDIIYFDQNYSWEREIREFSDDLLKDIPVQVGTIDDALNIMTLIGRIYSEDRGSWYSNSGIV